MNTKRGLHTGRIWGVFTGHMQRGVSWPRRTSLAFQDEEGSVVWGGGGGGGSEANESVMLLR